VILEAVLDPSLRKFAIGWVSDGSGKDVFGFERLTSFLAVNFHSPQVDDPLLETYPHRQKAKTSPISLDM
jgi:hypothetical protein